MNRICLFPTPLLFSGCGGNFVTLKYAEMKNVFDIKKHRDAVMLMSMTVLHGRQEALKIMKKIIREREEQHLEEVLRRVFSREVKIEM